jgi:hypothetical protein
MKFEVPQNSPRSNAATDENAAFVEQQELEEQLRRLKPRGLRAELRPRVLAAVNVELLIEPPFLWLRRAAVGLAASLLFAVALNIYVMQAADSHVIKLFGSLPVPNANAERAMAEYQVLTQKMLAENECFGKGQTQ